MTYRIHKERKAKVCVCGVRFTPMSSLQKYCSPACKHKYVTGNVDTDQDLMKVPYQTLYAMATGAFQAARKRVLEPKCYTCGRESKPLHCGHAFKKEIYRGMVFSEKTTRTQCDFCNIGLSGNEDVFHEKLRDELGTKEYESLLYEAYASKDKQWKRIELIEIITKYQK